MVDVKLYKIIKILWCVFVLIFQIIFYKNKKKSLEDNEDGVFYCFKFMIVSLYWVFQYFKFEKDKLNSEVGWCVIMDVFVWVLLL